MTTFNSFINSKKVQKTLATKPGEEGFSLVELVVVIAVLAILSAVAIPAFVGVQANARASAVKNALVNGLKECVVVGADNKTTSFDAAQSFATAGAFQGYTMKKKNNNVDSCFSAWADATDDNADSDFNIEMNTADGSITKTCANNSRAGCDLPTGGSAGGAGTW
tara:strand:+ start:674 stop:1168 length:495 start_codon:yes stop_codon:yes gene_type:complete